MRHKSHNYVDPQMTCLKTFMFVYVVSYGNVYVLNTTEVAWISHATKANTLLTSVYVYHLPYWLCIRMQQFHTRILSLTRLFDFQLNINPE